METQKASDTLEEEIGERARFTFQPLPAVAENAANPITDVKLLLGKILFFDNRLSKDQTHSCNTCHDLTSFVVDRKPSSPGDAGELGSRNSPTVHNSALYVSQD